MKRFRKTKKTIACILVMTLVYSFLFQPNLKVFAKQATTNPKPEQTQNLINKKISKSIRNRINTKKAKKINERYDPNLENVLELEMDDGSITAYAFSEDIKFIKDGEVKYKETSIVAQNNNELLNKGYDYTNGANDYRINFSSSLSTGINVQCSDYNFSYIPIPNDTNENIIGHTNKIKIDGNDVDTFEYNNVFGDNTILRYTPQLNSVQKDIILKEYQGQNEFNFIFKLNGNKATLSKDNRRIDIINPNTNKIITSLSPIFAYDSFKGKSSDYDHFTDNCEYKLTEIGPSSYKMTIVVSKEYLENPKTVYPVTIDPAPTISNDYDSSVYSGVSYVNYANATMGSGHSLDYGCARAYMKFTLPADIKKGAIINSATYNVRETTGRTGNTYIGIYRVTSSWNNNVLWTNKPSHYSTALDKKNISNAGGVYTYSYNIKTAVNDWINKGQTNYGLALVSDDENKTTSIWRSFATKEYSTSSFKPYAVINYTNDTTVPTISSITGNPTTWTKNNAQLTVNATDNNPSTTLSYSFSSSASTYNWQTSKVSPSYSANSTVYVSVKDLAGNIKKQTVTISKIDKTSPVISAVNGNPTNYTNNAVTLTVNATDNVAISSYSFDNGVTWQASNSKMFSENGTIYIKAKDSAGNITGATPVIISKITSSPIISSINGNPTDWTNQDVTLTVKASGTSEDLQYSFDNGVTWQDTNYKTYSQNTSDINIKVKDNSNNITEFSSIDISKIDKSSPEAPEIYDNNGMYRVFAPQDKTPDNSISPVTNQYKIGNDGKWYDFNTEFSIDNLSPTEIFARSIDTAGNISNVTTITSKDMIGAYSETVTDLSFDTSIGDFSISRSYNSNDNLWNFSYDIQLLNNKVDQLNNDGSITSSISQNVFKVIFQNGETEYFENEYSGIYTNYMTNDILELTKTSSYVLTKDDIRYYFDSTGKIDKIADLNNNTLSFQRIFTDSSNTTLSKIIISDNTSRSLSILFSDGKPSQITNPANNNVYYSWINNNLASVTDPMSNVTNYEYTNNKISKSDDETIQYGTDGRLQKILYKNGSYINYSYDDKNREIMQSDSNGQTQKVTYFNSMRIATETDEQNNKSEYTYDERGNVYQVNKYKFENNEYVGDGTNNYIYDSNNFLIEELSSDGSHIYYRNDAKGRIITKAVQKQDTTPTEDEIINLSYEVFDLTFYQYDIKGNQTLTATLKEDAIPSTEQIATLDSEVFNKTIYTYNTDGTINSIQYEDTNKSESYSYDSFKNITSITYSETNEGVTTTQTELFQYDILGQLISQTTKDGKTNSFVYDLCGNKIRETLDGKTTRYVYNNGKLIQQVDSDYYNTVDDGLNASPSNYDYLNTNVGTRYLYDAVGNLKTITDKYDRTTTYTYDSFGNMISQKFHVYEINYDNKGNTTNVKVGTQNLVSYDYSNDLKQNLTNTTYGNGHTVEYFYENGNVIGIKLDGATDFAFEYTYDENNTMTQKTDHINNLKTDYSGDTVTVSTINTDGSFTPIHIYSTTTVDEIKQFVETTNGTTFTTQWLDNLDKFIINDDLSINKAYIKNDDDKITTTNIYSKSNGIENSILSSAFTYGTTNTDQIASICNTYGYGKSTTTFSYTYDDKGNISSVSRNGTITAYKYDSLNQLIRVDDGEQNKTYTYTYDVYGNILSKSEYALTDSSSEPTNPLSTISYGYSDSNWTDKMTSYNGQAITYDEIGNPLSYDGWTFVWESGRQLKRMTKDGSTIDYKYDDSGIRTSKTVNGVTTNYTTIDGRITSQNDGTNFLYFRYDSNNELVGVQINGTEYIYLKNLQGDVVSILDMNGQCVVNYTYDAWGKVTSITGSMADTIGNLNPMRYRSYYYDNESGYYYLQSRYYDSNTCRFINADESSVLELTKGQAVGHNLFAYCGNDPINNIDPSGYGPVGAIIGGILGFGLGALIVPNIADMLKLKGWKRKVFIWAGVAAITALGAYVGYYVGEIIFKIYKAGGKFALKINGAIARGITKLVGGTISSAKGNGWVIKVGKLTLRIMTEGGGRVNYFRLSHATKGAMTILGTTSSDRALTHINITFSNIVKIVNTILDNK